MKRRILLTMTVVLATPLSWTLGRAQAAEKTLTVGAAVFTDTLRSGQGSFAAYSLSVQTNEPLVARDNKGALHPALATSWETIDPHHDALPSASGREVQ